MLSAVTTDVAERYRRVIRSASPENVAAWAATGRAGLLVLREDLAGRLRPEIGPGVHPRDQIDNLTAAVAAIAAAEPEAFLEVFPDEASDDTSFVLTGLGQIDDPRATARLVRAADSSSDWIRMDAAIGLGRRRSAIASAALVRLLDDRAYLVRYHALRSLASVGDASSLSALRAFAPQAAIERTLADEAIAMIEARASDDGANG
jgi:HEAT repeat protein